MSDIYSELQWRGLVYQTTDDENLGKWLSDGSRVVYAGFDPTADSLHVGSLLPLMMLRRFQKAGHRPIAIAGGATGMIGDPSGKSAERNLLSEEQLATNLAGIEAQMRMMLDFEGDKAAMVVNNFDWMNKFSYIDFLRDVGKNAPVGVMLAKDSVKSRLGGDAGLSYTEFSYMLLQAYDFVHLNKEFGCELQIGGSDQWGNVTAGIDLGRRMNGAQLYGLTCPLLTKADGEKMGKTATGAVWLSADKTSPYDFHQYWFRTEDSDVSKCLRFLTELGQEEIEALDASRESDPGKRESQIRLADELTRMIHGEEGLQKAAQAKEVLFGGEIKNLNDADLGQIFNDVSNCSLSFTALDEGIPLVDAMVQASLSKSKGEARRTIEQGGGYINNQRVEDVGRSLGREDLASETVIVLRSGKRKYALLRFE